MPRVFSGSASEPFRSHRDARQNFAAARARTLAELRSKMPASMPRPRLFALTLTVMILVACGRQPDTAPPVATPTVALSRGDAAIGAPMEIKYRFVVSPDAPPFGEDYWVFVHFLDADRE